MSECLCIACGAPFRRLRWCSHVARCYTCRVEHRLAQNRAWSARRAQKLELQPREVITQRQ
jgi:hypothetical protein